MTDIHFVRAHVLTELFNSHVIPDTGHLSIIRALSHATCNNAKPQNAQKLVAIARGIVDFLTVSDHHDDEDSRDLLELADASMRRS